MVVYKYGKDRKETRSHALRRSDVKAMKWKEDEAVFSIERPRAAQKA
jgi:hypothetical protein